MAPGFIGPKPAEHRIPYCSLMYGERDQAPETIAKSLGGVGGFGPHGQGAEADQHDGQGGKHPGVGEPALGPVGTAQGKTGGAAVLDISGHGDFLLLVLSD